ncbi:MAG: hypothetical protein AMXMBFR64_02460 [Myxococcales bacterium]
MIRAGQTAVVIGSGPVGAASAWALATAGVHTTVLEAGPRPPADRFAVLQRAESGAPAWPSPRYAYESQGDDPSINRLTLRMLGGTSLTWGAVTPRFLPADFRMQTLYGVAEDWPLTYEELEPWYVRAERLLGVSGTVDNPWSPPRSAPYPMGPFAMSETDRLVQAAGAKVGVPFHHVPTARNSIPYDGRPACQSFATCRTCPIGGMYSADQTMSRIERLPHVRVLTEAEAVRIETSRSDAVCRVLYLDASDRTHAVEADVVVVATQAVEAVRLLLNSASGAFPQGLANRNGQLGRWFMDRPKFYVMGRVDQRLSPYRLGFETATSLAMHDHPGRSEYSGGRILVRENAGPSPADVSARSGLWGQALREEIAELFGHWITLGCYLEPLPREDNRVTLSTRLRGRAGLPAPRVDLRLMGPYVERGYHELRRVMERILEAAGAHDVRVLVPPSITGHYMGGHRMGSNPETSTINSCLQAHDVPGLYLATAGAFPSGGISNPTLTTIALALRMAASITGG